MACLENNKIYHWTAPVRILHWIRAVAIAILIFTGLYIQKPFLSGGDETMAWNRFFHLLGAYLLVFGFVFRSYLMFFSKDPAEADWKELLPLPRNLKGLPQIVKYYLFMTDYHPRYKRYNPIQGPVYLLIGILTVIMAMTGFAIYTGWLHPYFNWVNALLGGESVTRVVHVLGMWLIIALSLSHIYLVLRQNALEKDRTFMSMIDGYVCKEHSND